MEGPKKLDIILIGWVRADNTVMQFYRLLGFPYHLVFKLDYTQHNFTWPLLRKLPKGPKKKDAQK